jgi:hypothetical protein
VRWVRRSGITATWLDAAVFDRGGTSGTPHFGRSPRVDGELCAVRVALAIVLVVFGLGVGACGQSDDRERVRSVTEAFVAAYAADDGEGACAQLSGDTLEELARQKQAACPEAVTELQLDPGAVAKVAVYLTNAKVDLRTGESVFLSEESEGWRLSALGCRPQGGKPADRPFDCELEA